MYSPVNWNEIERSEKMNDWVQFLSIGSNITVVLIAIKVIRDITRIELKVDTMWSVFMRNFGSRTEGIK